MWNEYAIFISGSSFGPNADMSKSQLALMAGWLEYL